LSFGLGLSYSNVKCHKCQTFHETSGHDWKDGKKCGLLGTYKLFWCLERCMGTHADLTPAAKS
jgi:hypothetical protein